ncbi:MAG: STAS domain-containing protein [Coriobacteriaceae bacterium]|nr:STAS domain-containing protein [Coriobacteriaceae bacterium]MDO4889726.1 STAS domain-containing protein [Coriobacteriaceae bacterium]
MFSVETNDKDTVVEAMLSGRLDVKAAKEADEAFLAIASQGKDVVLDMSDLVYIASAGLRALKRLRVAVRDNGKTVTLRNVQEDVMDILEMTGFAAMFSFE